MEIEKEFQEFIERVFENTINDNIKKYGIEKVGLHLGGILKSMDSEVVSKVVPRAIEKHTEGSIKKELKSLISKDKEYIFALRKVGVSVANSLRPIAGNKFTLMVDKILKPQLNKIGLDCVTSGPLKSKLNKALVVKTDDGDIDLKPDLDIIVFEKNNPENILAIISCKTTLAERVMQTIRWKDSMSTLDDRYRKIKVYLVTAWEIFENPTHRNRAHQLDGAYSCNENIKEDSKVKKFDKLILDIAKLK